MTPGSVVPMPNTPGTPRRTIRISDDLWDAATAKAAERGESLSEVIRKYLIRYARK
jgi:predicted CopG family antitoxin